MPTNLLRICYESTTNFFIREFRTKILNSSKLLSRTPEYSRIIRIVYEQSANQLITPRITNDTAMNPCISGFLAIHGISSHSVIGVCGLLCKKVLLYDKLCKWCITPYMTTKHTAVVFYMLNPLPDMPILGSSNSAANKDIM